MSSRVVLGRDPEAQDLGAVLRDEVLGRDALPTRLRHLPPLAVDDEAVGEHGAVGRRARGWPPPSSSEEWNQPRCWSEPSRYMSAGQRSSGRVSSTAAWLQPESNQTSRMSVSLRNVVPPHCSDSACPAGSSSAAGRAGTTRRAAPLARRCGATCSTTASSSSVLAAGLAVERHDRHAPHALARDAPVGRGARSCCGCGPRPTAGSSCTRVRSRASARSRSAAWSSATNHCSVARKSVGFLQRQQCG